MAVHDVRMPKYGSSTSGAVVEWYVAVGDSVAAGESLCTIETEKVTVEVESPVAGTVAEIRAEVDEEIGAGAVIATVAEAG
jgi:2-oxoglutarate dehydrogenase E2 component (dihydrolipoamide succinyltransferase)